MIPMLTDWLMVIITAIYVVATGFICWANISAANASKGQLVEIQRQFAEENRAHIEVEFLFEKRLFYGLRFVNHGKSTANNVRIQIDQAFIESISEHNFAEMLRSVNGKECIIGVGQHYDVFFGSTNYRRNPNICAATGVVHYQSNGQEYLSEFYIDLENYATIFSIESEQEDIQRKIDKLTSELAGIREVLLMRYNSDEENPYV